MLIKTSVHHLGDISGLTLSNQQPVQGRANDHQTGGSHYKDYKYETWDVIVDWNLGYLDGNAVKYLSRWRHKGNRTGESMCQWI